MQQPGHYGRRDALSQRLGDPHQRGAALPPGGHDQRHARSGGRAARTPRFRVGRRSRPDRLPKYGASPEQEERQGQGGGPATHELGRGVVRWSQR